MASPFQELNPLKIAAWADFIRTVREFFYIKDVLEVTTPLLAPTSVTDPNISSIKCELKADSNYNYGYLQTSPEYAMKRLLAAGSGCIYQICPAFRDDAYSPIHRAEFTMLEWYRLGYDYNNLMLEVAELLKLFWPDIEILTKTYADIFKEYLSLNIYKCTNDELRGKLENSVGRDFIFDHKDDYLDALFSLVIQPRLKNIPFLFLINFPASQGALAVTAGDVASRFELFIHGVEIANGYSEQCDYDKIQQRFADDNKIRRHKGLPIMSYDKGFLAAMASGMPACAGVAVGLDRLFMLFTRDTSI